MGKICPASESESGKSVMRDDGANMPIRPASASESEHSAIRDHGDHHKRVNLAIGDNRKDV